MLFDSLFESLWAGGWVLFPIFLVGSIAFAILLHTALLMGPDLYCRDFKLLAKQWAKKTIPAKGLLLQMLEEAEPDSWKNRADGKNKLQLCFLRATDKMYKGMHFVSVLAAAAPLLGLLGTVSGMVGTFDVITVYGNANPILMADGISEALITTQSGLVIAFPLVLWKHRMEDRIEWVRKQMQVVANHLLNDTFGEES